MAIVKIDHISYFDLTNIRVMSHEGHGVSKKRQLDRSSTSLFRQATKGTSKPHKTGSLEGKPPVTGAFPSQRDGNANMCFCVLPSSLSDFGVVILCAMVQCN